MSTNEYERYAVAVEKFAERHYLKQLSKRYKDKWPPTQKALEAMCVNPIRAIERGSFETITDTGDVLICKYEMRVAGTKQSARRGGVRAIIAVHCTEKISRIMLVYHKNDLGKGNETQLWKKIVRNTYSEYKDIV